MRPGVDSSRPGCRASGVALCLFAGMLMAGCAEAGPVRDSPPNAAQQTPAFAAQTRAPVIDSGVATEVTEIADGLVHPWGMAFLPDGAVLVTERPGRMRLVTRSGGVEVSEPIGGLPEVDARGAR